MAKRFTTSEKWADPWFRKLSPKAKLLWDWLFTNCDAAGSIDPDLELASFQIGETISDSDIDAFGDRVIRIGCNRYWLPKFIPFQYGELREAVPTHRGVFSLIERLCIPYQRGLLTPQDKDKDKDKDSLSELASELTWRTSFEEYSRIAADAFRSLSTNLEWQKGIAHLYPGINIKLSLEKAHKTFWGTDAGWQHKKKSRSSSIDMVATYKKALDNQMNRVYLPRNQQQTESVQTTADDGYAERVRKYKAAISASTISEEEAISKYGMDCGKTYTRKDLLASYMIDTFIRWLNDYYRKDR
jgi:hypothetical protein